MASQRSLAAQRKRVPAVLLDWTQAPPILQGAVVPRYLTLDDASILAAVRADPQGFLEQYRSRDWTVIDEVQRAPELLVAIKREIDLDRRPGRFLLTGSANVLTFPRIAESLAGRMEPLRMWSLAQCELEGTEPKFLDTTFESGSLHWENAEARSSLLQRAMKGGYPEALSRPNAGRRNAWFGAYLNTVVQREIKTISAIEDETAILRILRTLASRSGGPRNITGIAADTGIPNTTIQRYVALLQATFLITELPPWFQSIDARLVKSPKILITDSGLYANLLNISDRDNQVGLLVETFVGTELMRLISFDPANRYSLMHFRTQKQHEVDFVIERADRKIVGVEVKMAQSVSAGAFSGLRALKMAARGDFHRGIVLYFGERTLPFGDNLWAVPISALWQT